MLPDRQAGRPLHYDSRDGRPIPHTIFQKSHDRWMPQARSAKTTIVVGDESARNPRITADANQPRSGSTIESRVNSEPEAEAARIGGFQPPKGIGTAQPPSRNRHQAPTCLPGGFQPPILGAASTINARLNRLRAQASVAPLRGAIRAFDPWVPLRSTHGYDCADAPRPCVRLLVKVGITRLPHGRK